MPDVDLKANVDTVLGKATADQAATLKAKTGVDVSQARVAAGAAAALSLAQSGFNPDSQGDQDKLVAAIAGGLCLIPGPGPFIGAGLEAMYQVAKVAACPTIRAFHAIGLGPLPPECGGKRCDHSGTWTPSMFLDQGVKTARGSFAELVMACLAMAGAKEHNCVEGVVSPSDVVDAVVAMWNHTHAGPAVDVYCPPLARLYAPLIPTATETRVNGKLVTPSNVQYAFAPMAVVEKDQAFRKASAFGPMGFMGDEVAPRSLLAGPPFDARVIRVNSGPTLPPAKRSVPAHLASSGPNPMLTSKAQPRRWGPFALGAAGLLAAVLAWWKWRR